MKNAYRHAVYILLSLGLAILVTVRTWGFELFSDDWIWLLISQEIDWTRPIQILTVQFSGFWRPVHALWFLLWRGFNDATPEAQHILSAILLALNGYLAGLVTHKYSKGTWAGIVALIFVIVNQAGAETWLWYSAIGDLLMGILILLLLLLIDGREKIWRLLLAIPIFILALLTKETTVMLFPLLLFWPPVWRYSKHIKVGFFGVYSVILAWYVWWQLQLTITRGQDISYGLTHFTVWIASWFETYIPWLGQFLLESSIVALIGVIVVVLLIMSCFYLYIKFRKDVSMQIIVFAFVASLFITLPTTLLSVSDGQLLASRYLFSASIFAAIAIGLLFSMYKTKLILSVYVVIGIMWVLSSQLLLYQRVNQVYEPINVIMTNVKVSLGEEFEKAGRLQIMCSFPYDHNSGYIKAMAFVVYNVPKQNVYIVTTPDPTLDARIIKWEYNENKFIPFTGVTCN